MHDRRLPALHINLEQQHIFLDNHVHSLPQRLNNLIVSTVINTPADNVILYTMIHHVGIDDCIAMRPSVLSSPTQSVG